MIELMYKLGFIEPAVENLRENSDNNQKVIFPTTDITLTESKPNFVTFKDDHNYQIQIPKASNNKVNNCNFYQSNI